MMGDRFCLLKPEDWKATWIGRDGPDEQESSPLRDARWIWLEGAAASSAPAEPRYFRRTFTLPAGRAIKKAVCCMTADDGFSLLVNLAENYPMMKRWVEFLGKRLDPDGISVQDLKDRLLFTQSLEAARCIEEGIVADPHEADVGAILGFGFAPFSGGVLSLIDGIGAKAFVGRAPEQTHEFIAEYVDPLLPDANRNGVSLGLGYDITSHLSVDAAYFYLKFDQRVAVNTIPQTSFDGTYTSHAHLASVDFGYRF